MRSEETRRLVNEVATRLGYSPNIAARNLKSGRSGLIGVVTLDLTAQYSLEIVRGIADELADSEREMLINASYQDATRERERVVFLARGLVDGMLLVAPVLDDDTIEVIRRTAIPSVIIDPRRLNTPLPRVTVDNYGGMRAGTQHLIEPGPPPHRLHPRRGRPRELGLRFQGFADAMRLAGVPSRTSSSPPATSRTRAGSALLRP